MEIPFYDNGDTDPMDDGWIDFERIYCFDLDAFSPDDHERLRKTFESLPQFRMQEDHGCWWWYSDKEDTENGYLTAGYEPPGLQVFGTLPVQKWLAWDREFRELATGLPVRSLN